MLSRTSEYALRAIVCLAQHIDEWPLAGHRIADETGIPPKYLSNILSSLVRAGVLRSTPGLGGGFAMVRSPKETPLRAVLEPFESILGPSRPCPFGNEICSDENPCAGHERWKRVKQVYAEFLQDTTVHEVSVEESAAKDEGAKERMRS